MNEKLLESWENNKFSTSYYEVVMENSDHKEYKCVVKDINYTNSIFTVHTTSISSCKEDTEKLLLALSKT